MVVRRIVARVMLSVWTAGVMLPMAGAHARVFDDVACGAGVVATAHPVPQFEAARAPVDDGHCAVCHLVRAIGGALVHGGHSLHAIDTSLGRVAAVRNLPSSRPRLILSSRAPPSLPLS